MGAAATLKQTHKWSHAALSQAMMWFIWVPSKLGCSLVRVCRHQAFKKRTTAWARPRRGETTMTRQHGPRGSCSHVKMQEWWKNKWMCTTPRWQGEKHTESGEKTDGELGGGVVNRQQEDTNDASGSYQERPMFKETPRHSQNAQLCVGKG